MDARLTKTWVSRAELRDMRVRRREGDNEIKKIGGREGQANDPLSKTSVDQPHPQPYKRLGRRMNPILPYEIELSPVIGKY